MNRQPASDKSHGAKDGELSAILGGAPLAVITFYFLIAARGEMLAGLSFIFLCILALGIFLYSIKTIIERRRTAGFLKKFFITWIVFSFLVEALFVLAGTGGADIFLASLVFIPLALLSPAVAITLGRNGREPEEKFLGIVGIVTSIISGFIVSIVVIIELVYISVKVIHKM